MVGNTNGIRSATNGITTLSVTPSGNYSTTNVYAYKGDGFIIVGGYFTSSSNASGVLATISGVNADNAANLSSPCQCDNNSVKWISFSNSGSNLVLTPGGTLTANNYVRFLCTLPLA